MFVVCCLLVGACCLLLFGVWCLLFVDSLIVVRCVLLVAC